ncbi:MAG: hypothetical protein LBQ26_00950 [Holosporales bacterium]|jgi:hypothetical protein|nr:hypothetical protein [Holosporales bacterium]
MCKFSWIQTMVVFSSALIVQTATATFPSDTTIPVSFMEGFYIGVEASVTQSKWKEDPGNRKLLSNAIATNSSCLAGYSHVLENNVVLGGEMRCDFFQGSREGNRVKSEWCSPVAAIAIGYNSANMYGAMGVTLGGTFIRTEKAGAQCPRQTVPEFGVFYIAGIGENVSLRTDVRYASIRISRHDLTRIASRMMIGIGAVYHF